MSFTVTSNYSRPILRPLRIPTAESLTASHSTSKQQPSTSPLWRATTHTFSGTGNRETPRCWPPNRFNEDPASIPNDNRYDTPYDPASADSKAGVYHLYEAAGQTTDEPVPIPRIVAKRYTPTDNVKATSAGITLFMLTGMGVPKEMAEPMMELLLPQLRQAGVQVDELWTVDFPMSGETAMVNPVGYLYGNEKDIARDLLLFITAYLPLEAGQELPDELIPRKPAQTGKQPVRRNLHAITHSLGAQTMMLCAAHAPNILSSLTAIDPAMIPSGKTVKMYAKLPKDVYCLMLNARYADRESLASDLRSNKRTRAWHEQAVRTFVGRALVPDEKGPGFRLSAHPRLEWALYYDKETPTQCYDRLTDLRMPLNLIMPERPFAVSPNQLTADIAKMPQKTRITWIANATHQVPYERPEECARAVASWLEEVLRDTPRANL